MNDCKNIPTFKLMLNKYFKVLHFLNFAHKFTYRPTVLLLDNVMNIKKWMKLIDHIFLCVIFNYSSDLLTSKSKKEKDKNI